MNERNSNPPHGGGLHQIKTMSFHVQDLGVIEYSKAYALQKRCVENIAQGGPQTLFLCEHPPVITLGRVAKEKHILFSREEIQKRGLEVAAIDRGGDVTLHAPGQIVAYPIFNLLEYGKDLHAFLFQLEQVAIDLLADFGIVANRISGRTGVWAGEKKIVSIGIGVRKWISFHGLALNVNTDLQLFSVIKPCGLDVVMTSMRELQRQPIEMAEVKTKFIHCFEKNFSHG